MIALRPRLFWLLGPLLAAVPAYAAEGGQKGPSEVIFIAELVLLMLVGRLLGEALLRVRQPAVMGQLIAGLLLGPTFFGLLMPEWQHMLFPKDPAQKAMIDAVSQFGILLLLLLAGMETDLRLVRQTGRASFFVSLTGIVVPFLCGFALGEFLPDSLLPDPNKRLVTSLFLGTALSIASVKIVAIVVREMNFMRRVAGQVILASAIIDDSIGWIIVSIIFSIALHGSVDTWSLVQSVAGTLLFMVASLTVGRRAVFYTIRFVNDHFVSEFAVITAILLIMGFMAMVTYAIGVHMVLGAFVAGILVGESPILTRHIDDQLRGIVTAFFAPVFFGIAGLTADLTILADPKFALFTAALIAIASIGKFGGAFIGGELGGLTKRESLAIACGMNARGSTEVIIATIGLSMGALTQDLFSMIVTMAVLTTIAMPPSLRWALSRIPLRQEEKQRIEREELEEKGFVPKLERLLIAIDGSKNGEFAVRIGGIIAGNNEMPTTVMHIQNGKKGGKTASLKAKAKDEGAKVEAVAERAEKAKPEDEKADNKVDVTTVVEKPSPEAIAEEAEKGYGLMVIGLAKTVARGNEFHDHVTSLADGFEGPLAVADARNGLLKRPLETKLDILVPVNGTDVSRRAAEVAIAIARASKAPLTALYVAQTGKNRRRSRRNEEAILKDIAKLAETYHANLKTAVRADIGPDQAILKQLARSKHNLVIMGVGRRPGEKLFFGDTAAAVLEKSESSLLFVAT